MPQTQTRVQVIKETPRTHEREWQLRLQWCRYLYPSGGMQYGYRFIWVREDGSLLAAREQTRIPSFSRSNICSLPRNLRDGVITTAS